MQLHVEVIKFIIVLQNFESFKLYFGSVLFL